MAFAPPVLPRLVSKENSHAYKTPSTQEHQGSKEPRLVVFRAEWEQQASTLLIGRNGTGKSTILRSIVLGLASASDANALLKEQFGSPFVSLGWKQGTIKVEYVDDLGEVHYKKTIIHSRGQDPSQRTPNAESVKTDGNEYSLEVPLIVALGAGRSSEGTSESTYSTVESTYSLFEYTGTFFQTELTLRRLKDYVGEAIYENVLRRIKEALGMHPTNHDIDFPRGGGVVVSGPDANTPIPLRAWADGYRITLNWLLDVYAWAMMSQESIDDEGYVHGILLIDEIEQHLHPLMQRSIIQSTKKLFPKMQLIASTHSPLVVQGAELYDIVALYRDGSTITSNTLRDYSLHSIEDIFTAEELFKTPPHSAEVEKLRESYRGLVSKTDRSESDQNELREIGRKLRDLRILPAQDQDMTLEQILKRISSTDDSC